MNPCQVGDFTCAACRLACQLAAGSQRLLQEWVLRRTLFLLAQLTAGLPASCGKQQAADQLYVPLLALQRLYQTERDSYRKICQLRSSLNQYLYATVNTENKGALK
ncbi:hypothetical protein QWY20_05050 [Alkalimonas sp. MEB108]|uniref:Uncharacterized protein n=1 Tax=Alkalimonas cellulosilytica TaxID=3058395 RepID=A0ABU7J369_9GAMM|nr:hypothetical protein [Alkalimonas sp. MEB108]MEE2000812.1 hypothetical protein [Alkalimonas sp. MEB108]